MLMDAIKMVDLHNQYLKIKKDIDECISNVIYSSAFINGPEVKKFREELANYLNVKHVISCANGTDALQIALMSLDLNQGDEVITPNFTFVATVEVIKLLGLKPVLVDVEKNTFNIDPKLVEKKISSKTKAIIPVHLYGQCANMKEIMELAQNNNLFVIEDTAQAIGAKCVINNIKHNAGTIGHIGSTSFFPSKNLGCYGDGGALFTNDDKLADKMQLIANHGSHKKYYHNNIGVNSRLDSIQAAILRIKLKHLDTYLDARKKAADIYDKLLSGVKEISLPVRVPYSDHVFHQYTIKVEEGRDELKLFLEQKNIPSMIYYPVPINKQDAYYDNDEYPVSDKLCSTVLSLPMHTELTYEQQEYICKTISDFYCA